MAAAVSFDDVYRREFTRVVNTLALACGDAAAAEDAASEAFVRALERWARISDMESPGGWITTVAWNALRRDLRRRAVASSARAADAPPPMLPSAVVDRDLWNAVSQLPPRARTAVALRYIADLPEAEVARMMGIRRGTVAATLHAARAKLAEVLEEEEAHAVE
jgi:RNA polymerase sigma-70 factor (ECF subfamily)